MGQQRPDVQTGTRSGEIELIGPDRADSRSGSNDGSGEERPGVIGSKGGSSRGKGRWCGHGVTMADQTGHLLSGFSETIKNVRADRLVAILLLLQARGQVTSAEVATELEVSERTARRDLEALGMAGLPVYSTQGRGGGWQLAGGGRTDLSGLTAAEAKALFLVAGTAPTTPELKAALRKLVRALPEPLRGGANAAAEAVIVDPTRWGGGPRPATPVHLDAMQSAVIDGHELELGYVARDRSTSTRLVEPYGLAAKGPVWYLIARTDAGLRTFRVDRIRSLSATGRTFLRPSDFDLKATWREVSDTVDQLRAPVIATAAVRNESLAWIRHSFGTRVSIGPRRSDGRIDIELRGHHASSLAAELASFGATVEVFDPESVRRRMAEIGQELVDRYGYSCGDVAPIATGPSTGTRQPLCTS